MKIIRLTAVSGTLLTLLLGHVACPSSFSTFRVHELVGGEVSAVDDEGFAINIRAELENPNPVGAELTNIVFTTATGQHALGSGRIAGPIKVAAKSRFLLTVPVRVRYDSLPADLPRRVSGSTLPLTARAQLVARTSFGSFDLTLTARGQTAISRALEVAVAGPYRGSGLRVERVDLDGLELRRVRLKLRLKARNRFAFALRVTRVRYELSINGSPFGTGKLDSQTDLPAKGSATFDLPVVASHGAVGRAIGAMLGSDPRFRVRGTVWIAPMAGVSKIPFDVTADSSVFGRR